MTAVLNENYLDILFKNTFSYFALLNPKGEILEISQRFLNAQESTIEQAIGTSLSILGDGLDKDTIQNSIDVVNNFRKPVRFEIKRLVDEQNVVISVTLSPVINKQGDLSNIVVEGTDISQQKLYEEQFVKEQAFKNAILDNTAEGICVYDTNGIMTYSNTVFKKLLNFKIYIESYNLQLTDIFDIYDDDNVTLLSFDEIPLGRTLKKGTEVKNFELIVKLKDVLPTQLSGLKHTFTPLNLSVSTRIIKDKDGKTTSIVSSYQDITEAKQARVTQAVLQERFSHAFENAVIGIVILSSRGVIIEANRALCSTLDYTPAELVGQSLTDITHQDDVTLTEMLFDEIESGVSNSIYYEKKLRHKSGLPVDAIVGISVSRDAQDQIDYVIAHVLDVTENNKITKALALSQKNYQSIFNSQLDAVVMTNLSGKILNLNPSAVKLFGYSVEEVDGLMFWELFSVKDNQLNTFEDLYKQGQEKIHTDTIRYLHKNGDAFPAETVGFLIFDGDGQRLGYTWIIQDISEKKIAEITLARINQRLAVSREEERRRLARELHDGIVQDLMGFSYELASFEGKLTTQDDFNLDAHDLKDMRGKLTNSIKQLRTFISDLRPVGLEEFGFQSALESYVALLERDRQNIRSFPAIKLMVDDVGELPTPINLCLFRSAQESLTNIIKHAKAKNVTITLAMKESANDSNLVLTIKDDGIGFKVPKDINDFSDRQHFGLIGINERVALIDGQLSVKSQISKGTSLTLTLPYERES